MSSVEFRGWLVLVFAVAAAIDVIFILRKGRPKILLLSTLLAFAGYFIGTLVTYSDPRFTTNLLIGTVLMLASIGVRQWTWR